MTHFWGFNCTDLEKKIITFGSGGDKYGPISIQGLRFPFQFCLRESVVFKKKFIISIFVSCSQCGTSTLVIVDKLATICAYDHNMIISFTSTGYQYEFYVNIWSPYRSFYLYQGPC